MPPSWRQSCSTRKYRDETKVQGITPRNAQVLEQLRLGHSNKLIAFNLGMAESTVKVHVRRIMREIRATNRNLEVAVWKTDSARLTASAAILPEMVREFSALLSVAGFPVTYRQREIFDRAKDVLARAESPSRGTTHFLLCQPPPRCRVKSRGLMRRSPAHSAPILPTHRGDVASHQRGSNERQTFCAQRYRRQLMLRLPVSWPGASNTTACLATPWMEREPYGRQSASISLPKMM